MTPTDVLKSHLPVFIRHGSRSRTECSCGEWSNAEVQHTDHVLDALNAHGFDCDPNLVSLALHGLARAQDVAEVLCNEIDGLASSIGYAAALDSVRSGVVVSPCTHPLGFTFDGTHLSCFDCKAPCPGKCTCGADFRSPTCSNNGHFKGPRLVRIAE